MYSTSGRVLLFAFTDLFKFEDTVYYEMTKGKVTVRIIIMGLTVTIGFY